HGRPVGWAAPDRALGGTGNRLAAIRDAAACLGNEWLGGSHHHQGWRRRRLVVPQRSGELTIVGAFQRGAPDILDTHLPDAAVIEPEQLRSADRDVDDAIG